MTLTLANDPPRKQVPPLALLLSLLCLWVPVLSSSMFPEWTSMELGVLVWLLALVPPFLLSYYRGWKGASLALAGGMAAMAISQVVVILLGAMDPRPEIMLGTVVVLIVVALGSGLISSLFHRSLGQAERMALTDPGTGLPNRRHAMLHLQRAFAAAQRGRPLSVVLFDLDRFKQVNDRYGHRTGDEVLRAFGEILAGYTRAMHIAARFGGEEFLVVLDDTEAAGASIVAERVRVALRERTFPCGQVTVSGGISQYENGMASPDVLIAAADQALYRAKETGRDRVMVLGRQGVDDAALEPVKVVESESLEGNGELVLVVDDDPAVLRTLVRGLRRRRYQPIEASDPHHALEIARGLPEPLDLVITDVVMPGMSGFRLVEMLMEIQPTVRALYISGYSREEVRWSGVPGTVKSFLPKPISLDGLALATRRALDAPLPAVAPAGIPRDHFDGRAALQDRLTARTAQLEEAHGEILSRLAWAAEYRDDVTGRHAERVARLSAMLAAELGLDDVLVGRIEQAALLHDLGKVAIPDSVLRKPAALTPTEHEIMQRHALVGARILSGSRHPLLQEAERIARSHHERWDGSGYPDGLAGEAIPVTARITAVADAWDCLVHTRPYRPGRGKDEALQEIRDGRGSQFDPTVVDALFALDSRDRLGELERVADVAGQWLGSRAHPDQGSGRAATGAGGGAAANTRAGGAAQVGAR